MLTFGLDGRIKRLALAIAMKRKAPSIVTISGEEAKTNNFFSARLIEPDGAEILVDEILAKGVSGRSWSGNSFELEAVVPNAKLHSYKLRILRYYGQLMLEYKSAISLIVCEALKIPFIVAAKNDLSQRVFNLKTPARSERMKLLRKLIQDRHEDAKNHRGVLRSEFNGKGVVQLLNEIHGIRIFGHPELESLLADLSMQLESLCESNDAKEKDLKFRATGKALHTIAEYEEQDRRHKRQMRLNWLLFWLTVASVAATGVQAYVAWKVSVLQK
jgi:hypothetical protein